MTVQLLLQHEVEQYLYEEAALLDSAAWQQWLSLFTEDMLYWIPVKWDGMGDPELQVHIVYDDHERLSDRIERLLRSDAYAQIPQSNTCHLISNVRVGEMEGDELQVAYQLQVTEIRRSKTTIYAGLVEQRLRRVNAAWRIRSKTIKLINSKEYLGNLSFML